MEIKTIIKDLDRTQVAVLLVRLLNDRIQNLQEDLQNEKAQHKKTRKILESAEHELRTSESSRCQGCDLWYYCPAQPSCEFCGESYCDKCEEDIMIKVCMEDGCNAFVACEDCLKENQKGTCKKCDGPYV